jgi:hypothetical protein
MDIRIQAPSEEKFQEVLEALRPIGVEVITGDDNPLVTALFYLARINSKLDNLGQLRHLHKTLQHVSSIASRIDDWGKINRAKHETKLLYNAWLYRKLVDATGQDPVKSILGLNSSLAHLTSDELRAMFEETGVIKP